MHFSLNLAVKPFLPTKKRPVSTFIDTGPLAFIIISFTTVKILQICSLVNIDAFNHSLLHKNFAKAKQTLLTSKSAKVTLKSFSIQRSTLSQSLPKRSTQAFFLPCTSDRLQTNFPIRFLRACSSNTNRQTHNLRKQKYISVK